MAFHGVGNAKDWVRRARELGCTVEQWRRSGELKIVPPGGGTILLINCRRKSAPVHLVRFVRRLERGLPAGTHGSGGRGARRMVRSRR